MTDFTYATPKSIARQIRPHRETPAVEQREPIRSEIDRQVAAYLARGGKIDVAPSGVSVAKPNYNVAAATGAEKKRERSA
jgi:SutA-like transcriptional regulator